MSYRVVKNIKEKGKICSEKGKICSEKIKTITAENSTFFA